MGLDWLFLYSIVIWGSIYPPKNIHLEPHTELECSAGLWKV